MDFQDLLPAFQIRQFHRHPPVKTPRPCERRIQRFRTVGGCQDDDSVVRLESVHLCQQLVQRLLPFVIAAHPAVTLLADGVDLIDKHDAGGFLLGLPEQIPDFRGAHADEHFHEFRTGHGEEGHI